MAVTDHRRFHSDWRVSEMIDFDYGPLALLLPIGLAFLAPFVYSFFVDSYDKKNPQIKG
jgi:hypothetical protein